MLDRLFVHKKTKHERQAALAVTALVVAVVAALALQLTDFTLEPPLIPLLPATPDLVQNKTAEGLMEAGAPTPPIPETRFGAEPTVFGWYPAGLGGITAGTTVVVLVRDGNRFAEIFRKPDFGLEAALAPYAGNKTESVRLSETVMAEFVDISRLEPVCYPPRKDGHPGICQITRVVFFEAGGALYSVGADGGRATDGELIEMARSLLPKT
jgi:hypothetical protein